MRVGHGRYALPTAKPAKQAAARFSGVVSHLSAAQVHGLEVLHVADQPWVTIPRNRKLRRRDGVHVGYGSTTREVTDGVRFGRDEIVDHEDGVAATIEQALRLRIVAADGRAVPPTGAGYLAS